MMPFPALRVGRVLVMAARDKDVRRQRIVFPPHFVDGCVYFAHGAAERHEGISQAIGRICSSEHNRDAEGQSVVRRDAHCRPFLIKGHLAFRATTDLAPPSFHWQVVPVLCRPGIARHFPRSCWKVSLIPSGSHLSFDLEMDHELEKPNGKHNSPTVRAEHQTHQRGA
jgi:hypothetical protein